MAEEQSLDQWREGLRVFDGFNELILLALFAVAGKPASMLDIGCGTGAMVKTARRLGVDAIGVDQMVTPEYGEGFVRYDLTQPLDLGRKFAMVMSIETAEHLQPEYADTIAESIARHVAPGGMLVFTAALPGQAGNGHYNCQPPQYWMEKLWAHGLRGYEEMQYKIALAWRLTPTQLHYLAANLKVMRMP